MSGNEHFVSHDPPEFLQPITMRDVMAHHEAGHLILLYYYGWQIGRFTCGQRGTDWIGSIQNRRIPNPPLVDTATNLENEARKLLAGELAARIRMGISTEHVVLPLDAPPPETLTGQTPLCQLRPLADQRHDAVRVLSRYHFNRDILERPWLMRTWRFLTGRQRVTWWTWIWNRHAETKILLHQHWSVVEFLAAKLLTVNPNRLDATTGFMLGQVNGHQLLHWCVEAGAPLCKPAFTPVAY